MNKSWAVWHFAAMAASVAGLCHAGHTSVQAVVQHPASPAFEATTSSTQLVGWAVGDPADDYATILYTTNGGAAWVRQGSPVEIADAPLSCVAAVDAQTAWAVGWTARGYSTIYHTTNGGGTWFRQGDLGTIGNIGLSKISACNRDVVWIGGAAGTVLRTTDGGQTWQNRSPAGYSNTFQGITALDANIAWAAGYYQDGYATILHTTNGGLAWVRQSTGGVTNMANILSIGAADAQRLWAVGFYSGAHVDYDGRIIGTTNGGATWDLLFHDMINFHANELYVVNTNQVWVALDPCVIRTLDGGQSWEHVGMSTPPYTMGICVPDGQNVWATSLTGRDGVILHIPPDSTNWIVQTPTNGCAGLMYVSMVRLADPATMGTLAITVTPSNGLWTLNGPPVGYTGLLCGTGSLAAVQVPEGNYSVSFTALPGFRTPSNQTVGVTAGQASVITGLFRSRQIGDYDGDGKTDVALYDGQSGDWVLYLSEYNYQTTEFNFGDAGWTAVAGDFDGDGRYDPCVVQTASGLWTAKLSGNGYAIGWATCDTVGFQPVRGDFDGDAKAGYTSADAPVGGGSFMLVW